jgi:alkanesulfonate monooxygenase SsuD/methylene tetrahydromethanopterin reductase-like flavin-dependent oxidoreductase (luciferase family)
MQFGAMVCTKIDDWQLIPYAEALGYDSAWVPDSQMIWSDCYATMALAAWHTSRIRLGTGVAVAGTRLAPVTAHSIASINRIAPGRVFLGLGTGHTAMRLMGQDPVPVGEFRDYLRVVRGLLDGEEVEYSHRGKTRAIGFLHRELGFVDLAHRVPIYVGANGPHALRAAGAYGDGRIAAGNEPLPVLGRSLRRMRAGAEEVGRSLTGDFHTAALTFACVLRRGETLASERVIDETGAEVTAVLHYWYEIYRREGSDAFVSDAVRDIWNDYLKHVAAMQTPEDRRFREVHLGHCTYLVPSERRFVTPDMIRASGGLVGEADEIVERLRGMEAGGLKEVTLLPPMAAARTNFKDFAELVIARYR